MGTSPIFDRWCSESDMDNIVVCGLRFIFAPEIITILWESYIFVPLLKLPPLKDMFVAPRPNIGGG